MRRTIAAAVLAASSAVQAQMVPWEPERPVPKNADGRYEYQEVVQAEGASATELMSRAKAWIATAYHSADSVIQLDDATGGRLIVKGNYAAARGKIAWFTIWHVLTIEAKDGRYRYTLTDFEVEQGGLRGPMEGPRSKYLGDKGWASVAEGATGIISSLKAAMQKPTPSGGADW